MKFHATVAALIVAALPLAASAQVTGPLTPPPAGNGTSERLIFDAMLAVARASATNPSAAQTATFDYTRAIERYRAHDYGSANAAALQAIYEAGRSPAIPFTVPTPVPLGTVALPRTIPIGNPAQTDAATFLAVARGALATCPAAHAAAAKTNYTAAADAYARGNYQATRLDARAVVDTCATSGRS